MLYSLASKGQNSPLGAYAMTRSHPFHFIPYLLETYPPELLLYAHTVPFTVLTQGHATKSSRSPTFLS